MVAHKRANQAFSRRAIHIVDDERRVVNVIASALRGQGYPVRAFTSSSRALQDIETNNRNEISMLIADIRMPDHSGFEIARLVKRINQHVPIILMTSFEINSAEFDVIFPSLHIDAFIRKPFEVQQLLDLVRKYAIYIS